MKGIPPKPRDNDFGVCAAEAISPDICERLINLSKKADNPRVSGKIQEIGSNVVDINVRSVDVWVIHEKYEWVDDLIIQEIRRANDEHFDFDLTGLMERPQLLRYPEGGKYDWHLDIGRGDSSTRKISISYVLNSEFDGGHLCFNQYGEVSIPFTLGQGCIFPSFLSHRVSEVTSGERWALVAWMSGSPFR